MYKENEPDRSKAIEHMKKVLESLGLLSTSHIDHLSHYDGTEERFVDYLLEYLKPFDPSETLKTFDLEETAGVGSGMVIKTGIPYRQACAHHLIPAVGYCSIGYIPGNKIVGLSKLVRITDQVCTSRPSLQEVICDTLADILVDYLEPRGVIVVIRAEHGCIACRGVASPGVHTTTSSIRGLFRDVPQLRQEFLILAEGGRNK